MSDCAKHLSESRWRWRPAGGRGEIATWHMHCLCLKLAMVLSTFRYAEKKQLPEAWETSWHLHAYFELLSCISCCARASKVAAVFRQACEGVAYCTLDGKKAHKYSHEDADNAAASRLE